MSDGAFTHPLIREAILRGMQPQTRARVAGRAALAAVPVLPRQALRVADWLEAPARRQELLELAARCAQEEGRTDECARARLRIADLPGISPPHRAQQMLMAVDALCDAGNHARALRVARAAMRYCETESLDPGAARLRLAGLLWQAGKLMQSGRLLEQVLHDPDSRQLAPHARATLALVRRDQGRLDEAQDNAEHAAREFQALSDSVALAGVMNTLASLHARTGNDAEQELALNNAIEMDALSGDAAGRARSIANLGLLHMRLDRLSQAENALRDALHEFARLRLPRDELRALTNLATLYIRAGRPAESRLLMPRARLLAAMLRQPEESCALERLLAEACIVEDEYVSAEWHARRGLELCSQLSSRWQRAVAYTLLAESLAGQSRDRDALAALQSGVRAARASGDRRALGVALCWTAYVLLRGQRRDDARSAALESLEVLDAAEIRRTRECLDAVGVAALVELAAGDIENASLLAADAVRLLDELRLSQPTRMLSAHWHDIQRLAGHAPGSAMRPGQN